MSPDSRLSLSRACCFGCGHRTATENGQEDAARADLPKVSTAFPIRKAIAQKTEQPGQIEAYAVAPIHAKVSGYVKTVLVDIGDKVQGPKFDSQAKVIEPGQILAVIDAPEWIEMFVRGSQGHSSQGGRQTVRSRDPGCRSSGAICERPRAGGQVG
jgi:hypothetical protein